MSTVERIQAILDCEVRSPIKDAAGIITPEGIDCGIKIKTLETCLAIAKQEEQEKESAGSGHFYHYQRHPS